MISFVLLSALIAFLVQGAMYMYAHNVIMGAVQDGARVAAAYNGTLDGGISHAQALARDGLGGYADGIAIGGREGGGLVIVEARGEMPLLVPGLAGRRIPLDALAVMEKERFRVRESRP